jgi:hypothetical protein
MDPQEQIKIYVDLWKSENPIKTQKLMAYFVCQSILAVAATKNQLTLLLFSFFGAIWSIWWVFCIGRTVAYQQLWQNKLTGLEKDLFPTSEDKKALPWYGILPAKYTLLAPPIVGAAIWGILFLYSLMAIAIKIVQ